MEINEKDGVPVVTMHKHVGALQKPPTKKDLVTIGFQMYIGPEKKEFFVRETATYVKKGEEWELVHST